MRSERSVDGDLRELSRLSEAWMSSPQGRFELALRAREARRHAVVDMSDGALDSRLRRMAAVSALCVDLHSQVGRHAEKKISLRSVRTNLDSVATLEADALPDALRTAIERLVARFAPRRVVLFGSHAWGRPDTGSDFDLLVLVRGGGDVRRLAGRMRGALRGIAAAFDIVVRDEDVWRRWANVPLTLEHRIEHEGKVLYDAR
jgi:predicted nucleotidyltransferase